METKDAPLIPVTQEITKILGTLPGNRDKDQIPISYITMSHKETQKVCKGLQLAQGTTEITHALGSGRQDCTRFTGGADNLAKVQALGGLRFL